MDESYAIQIVNIDPNYPQEIKNILEKDPILRDLSDDELLVMIQNIRDLQS
jgi:DNA-directed RNA polymerase subunit F